MLARAANDNARNALADLTSTTEGDGAGNLQTLAYPDGATTVTYQYDALNRATKALIGAGGYGTLSYDALGRRQTLTFHDGSTRTWRYDNADHMTRYAEHAHDMPPAARAEVQTRLTNLTEHYCFVKMLRLSDSHPPMKLFVENLAQSLGFDLQAARQDVRRLAPAEAGARLRILEKDIETMSRRYGATGADGKAALSAEERFALGAKISEATMEANFLSVEANIGPGANRSLLGKVDVQGPGGIRRQDAYCTNWSWSGEAPCFLRPGARRAMGRPSSASRPATNSGAPTGRPVASERRSAS